LSKQVWSNGLTHGSKSGHDDVLEKFWDWSNKLKLHPDCLKSFCTATKLRI